MKTDKSVSTVLDESKGGSRLTRCLYRGMCNNRLRRWRRYPVVSVGGHLNSARLAVKQDKTRRGERPKIREAEEREDCKPESLSLDRSSSWTFTVESRCTWWTSCRSWPGACEFLEELGPPRRLVAQDCEIQGTFCWPTLGRELESLTFNESSLRSMSSGRFN